MKKISFKIIVALIAVFLTVSIVPRLVFYIISNKAIRQFIDKNFGLAATLIAAFVLITFSATINRLVVRRIKMVSEAAKKVTNGEYNVTLDEKGKDEISILCRNFNSMVGELNANAYLSKTFVRNVSHEIKTPISSISGFAIMIEEECADENIKKYAKIIQQESERISQMSQAMLQLSLLDSSKIIAKNDKFKPSVEIRDIVANLQLEWSKRNLSFDVELEEFDIVSNAQLIYQLCQNLISNAIKFSKEQGVVTIRLFKDESRITLTVANDGEGIKEEDKPRIFEQFFVSNKAHNGKSTGLGLSICKAIIEKLGGEITFDSIEGKGSTFTVILIDNA